MFIRMREVHYLKETLMYGQFELKVDYILYVSLATLFENVNCLD